MAVTSGGNAVILNPMPGPSEDTGYLGTWQGSVTLGGDGSGGAMAIGFELSETALGRGCIYVPIIVTCEDNGTLEDIFLGINPTYRAPGISLPIEMKAVSGRNCGQYHGRLPMLEVRGPTTNVIWFTRTNESGKNMYVDVFGLLINKSRWAMEGMPGIGVPVGGY